MDIPTILTGDLFSGATVILVLLAVVVGIEVVCGLFARARDGRAWDRHTDVR